MNVLELMCHAVYMQIARGRQVPMSIRVFNFKYCLYDYLIMIKRICVSLFRVHNNYANEIDRM